MTAMQSWRNKLMAPIDVTDRHGKRWDLYMAKAEAIDFDRGGPREMRGYEWTWVGLEPGTEPTRAALVAAIGAHRSVVLMYPTPHPTHLEADLGHAYWAGVQSTAIRPFSSGSDAHRQIVESTKVLADDLIAEDQPRTAPSCEDARG